MEILAQTFRHKCHYRAVDFGNAPAKPMRNRTPTSPRLSQPTTQNAASALMA